MFIRKIILDNFRIFRGKHEFDFSNKKVIVVEGPNGHGKSTIFDSINWVISGKISRYTGSSEHQQFNYIINSDACLHDVNEASVEISFNNEEELTIKRTIKKNSSTKLFINGQQIGLREGQKEIVRLLVNEQMLTDPNLLDSIDLLSFIESTLILSQENLEEFVRGNKPTERYSKLEQILGLARYGKDFKEYLQELKKDYLMEYNHISLKRNDLKHKQELLNAEYQPKLQQSERNGNKSKTKILDELNTFCGNLENYSFYIHQNFDDITPNEYEKLKKYIESIDDELKILEFFKFEIEQKEIYVNDIESKAKIINFKTKIDTLKCQKYKREKGLEQISLIREKLNNVSLTNKYLGDKKSEKENIEIDINNTVDELGIISKKIGINHASLSVDEISTFNKNFKLNSDLLKGLINKQEILGKEEHLTKLVHKEEILETDLGIKNKIANDLQNEIKIIDKQILDLNSQKNSTLESQIYTIINEVQVHLMNSDENKCLVCGSTYNSSKELKDAIKLEIENSNKLLNGFEIAVNECKVKRNNLSVKLNVTEQGLNISQKELDNLRSEIIELKNKIEIMRFKDSIDIEDIKKIQLEIEKVQTYKQENENKYKGYIEIKKALTLLEDLKQKRDEISEEEKEIIKKHNSYKYFIGDQRRLQLKLNKIDSYINIAKMKIQGYDKQVLELEHLTQEVERNLELLAKIKNQLEDRINCELVLNSSDILSFIIENISLLKNEKLEASKILTAIEKYLDDIILRELESKIKNYDQENLLLKKQIEQYEKVDEQLKNLITYHTQVQGSLVNEYLNGLSLVINNYFRQISPHSYFNYINLITKKNELFILLKDTQIGKEDIEADIENSTNASLTLSAAQSTILAMSIFLALNKSQNWSKLNVIGIDDPFQNLDDINAYSFIDVISNLVAMKDRQVLISTHDSDFARLSIRKLNLSPDDYAYVKIKSYTREAIEIQSEQYRSFVE
ncbi:MULTISPECIES: AAA family ATPase [Bacillus cereus group]|uniref:AAA family ATPase n=1 Tax=Bacillus cereus group TaxID=86661 RepID=UPI000A3616CB|nr:SMC family ATPase [Bacillus thuringiensis]MEB8736442.1 SMC family ATPase [Bacillus cereus]MEB8905271.1 SMC family ATPase [Bacillus cereus]MEB9986226.1 SMC family ATPase [Bacillus cereus]MEB9991676.1 SMC family ATPase [Bacillus cereus]MEC3111338.1 SMC family ATPase [Bacillus cereus]